jgi:UDP-N-acetylmuramyl pentapeptide phosphotransferase/UDP-N-acetylglucosamine-1-phosphate transferase
VHQSHDLPGSGPQKFHHRPTPRIGGIPIVLGLVAGIAILGRSGNGSALAIALLCGLFAFAAGLAEDFTKQTRVQLRLVFTFISAGFGYFLLDARITDLNLPVLDSALHFTAVSFAFTLFAVGGFANAVNIIDGFNGLAGVVALIFLGAIAYVAQQVGDSEVMWACLLLAATLLGFVVWNYPRGAIFLGDGGAYLVGFLIAELAVMLVHRNSEVSPWFALTLLLYPVFETMFSIYRKRFVRQQSPGEPDGLHLHMLIHKRLIRTSRMDAQGNPLTSPYLWILSLVAVLPAAIFWSNDLVLQIAAAIFAVVYVRLYASIVRFRTPRLLVLRRMRRAKVTEIENDAQEARTMNGRVT